ncbi:hypothetical protein QE152_g15681 [Popillia japonica]|uniref:Uncharacterized protein n=1 Tax=Popillia japonica TaxID=7064 RepID=A0AAW1L7U3_POPJA
MYCLYSFSVLQDKLFNFWYEGESLKKVLPARTTNSWLFGWLSFATLQYEGESLKKVLPARTTNSWLFGWLSFATLQPYSELPRINLIESTGLCRPVILSSEIVPEEGLATGLCRPVILSSEIVPEEGLATLSQKEFSVV